LGANQRGFWKFLATGHGYMNKIDTHRLGSVFRGAFVGPASPESAPSILYWGCSKGGLIVRNVHKVMGCVSARGGTTGGLVLPGSRSQVSPKSSQISLESGQGSAKSGPSHPASVQIKPTSAPSQAKSLPYVRVYIGVRMHTYVRRFTTSAYIRIRTCAYVGVCVLCVSITYARV